MTRLEVDRLSVSYGAGDVVHSVTVEIGAGEFVGLIGPNGSGKTSLLKAIYRALQPSAGRVTLDGRDFLALSGKAAARQVGVLGQDEETQFDFTVRELVAMGRTPHKGLFSRDTPEDLAAVDRAMADMGIADMADRGVRSLSGGERQRVLMARVMAQETDFLFLDEPTNHLDVGYQMQIFDRVRAMDVTAFAAVHDLNMAALYCDRIYAMRDGVLYAQGTPEEVLTPEAIYALYGVRAQVEENPMTGRLQIAFLPEGCELDGKEERRDEKTDNHPCGLCRLVPAAGTVGV